MSDNNITAEGVAASIAVLLHHQGLTVSEPDGRCFEYVTEQATFKLTVRYNKMLGLDVVINWDNKYWLLDNMTAENTPSAVLDFILLGESKLCTISSMTRKGYKPEVKDAEL